MKIKIALRANNPCAEEGYPIRGGKYGSKFRKRTYKELEEQVEEFTMAKHIDKKLAEFAAEAEAERRRHEKDLEDFNKYEEGICWF